MSYCNQVFSYIDPEGDGIGLATLENDTIMSVALFNRDKGVAMVSVFNDPLEARQMAHELTAWADRQEQRK